MGKRYNYTTTFTFDGKRYVVRANTEQELWQKKALKLRDLEEGRVEIGANMPVKAWGELALSTYKPNVSERVMQNMRYQIGKHIYSEIGNMPIRSVRPLHCQNIINKLAGKSSSTIRMISQDLKFIFRTAVENKVILENPASYIVLPEGTKGRRRSLTAYEEEHFLKICDEDCRFMLFQLMYYCGCRPAEACGCIGKDIDKEKRLLHIRGTKTANADRYVPISAVLFEKIKNTPPFEFIAHNQAGGRINEPSYDRAVSSLKRAMNISMGCKLYRNQLVPPLPLAEDLVPYDFRHTYCTNLAKSGVDIRTAQKLMGHASIQMTANIYTHVDESQIMAAADLINQFHEAKNQERLSRNSG